MGTVGRPYNPLAGMTVSMRLWRMFAPKMLRVRDFSGGLNLRDAAPELAANESPDLWNVTLDERGGVAKRLGYTKYNAVAFSGGLVQTIFEWNSVGKKITQAGASLYLDDVNTARHTFTTSARVGITEFAGSVWAVHPVDGLYSSADGITWVAAGSLGTVTVTIASPAVFSLTAHGLAAGDSVIFQTTGALPTGLTAGTTYYVITAGLTADAFEVSATAAGSAVNTSGSQSGTHTAYLPVPKGSSLIAWQNRLLSVGNLDHPTRVEASAIGKGNDWRTGTGQGWNNEIREKDNTPVLCLGAATGIDIAGRPGLIACKRDSSYRIYDSNSGAYSTLDPNVGAASSLSVTTLFGRTIILSRYGIYWTDGVSALTKASARVDPIFHPDALAEDQLDLCAAGNYGDRCYFSLPTAGKTANDIALEYHPAEGWIVQGSNAMSCYAVDIATQGLYGGSPSVSGQAYKLLQGGADDGVAIASWFQTKWVEPNDGFFTRFRAARVLGRGDFEFYCRSNYSSAQGVHRTVSLTRGGFTWNDPAAVWNDPTMIWGPAVYETYSQKLLSLGTGRSCSFRIEETSSISTTAPALDGSGSTITVGAWALGGIDLEHVQLGIS